MTMMMMMIMMMMTMMTMMMISGQRKKEEALFFNWLFVVVSVDLDEMILNYSSFVSYHLYSPWRLPFMSETAIIISGKNDKKRKISRCDTRWMNESSKTCKRYECTRITKPDKTTQLSIFTTNRKTSIVSNVGVTNKLHISTSKDTIKVQESWPVCRLIQYDVYQQRSC